MPKIRSLDTKKASRARDRHRKTESGNDRLDKVFNCVIRHLSHGIRNVTYQDIAEWTGLDIGSVKYYFNKLVHVGAINLQEKEVPSNE